jgi:DNA polymerase-3 subunit epsilon
VYLAMTGGQAKLTLSAESDLGAAQARRAAPARLDVRIIVIRADETEMAAHEHVLALLDKASGGKTMWRKL